MLGPPSDATQARHRPALGRGQAAIGDWRKWQQMTICAGQIYDDNATMPSALLSFLRHRRHCLHIWRRETCCSRTVTAGRKGRMSGLECCCRAATAVRKGRMTGSDCLPARRGLGAVMDVSQPKKATVLRYERQKAKMSITTSYRRPAQNVPLIERMLSRL